MHWKEEYPTSQYKLKKNFQIKHTKLYLSLKTNPILNLQFTLEKIIDHTHLDNRGPLQVSRLLLERILSQVAADIKANIHVIKWEWQHSQMNILNNIVEMNKFQYLWNLRALNLKMEMVLMKFCLRLTALHNKSSSISVETVAVS